MITTIDQALTWIHSKRANGRRPSQLRMLWLLEQVSHPHHNFPAIHIVGTNGKGSTLAFLRSILNASGYKVGSFSSPFITEFNERIAINSQNISDEDLVLICQIAYPIIESQTFRQRFVAITEFELVTFIMFIYFGQINPVDIAIIEAGVGGEKDATAVLKQIALILTSVGYDHQDVLGQNLLDIAKTKLLALHPHHPLYLNVKEPSIIAIAKTITASKASKMINTSTQACLLGNETDFSIRYNNHVLNHLQIQLLGKHQLDNACLAICLALDLKVTFPKITEESIASGLKYARWPGRTEWIKENLMLDGAHNRDGLHALAKLIKRNFEGKEVEILFAGLTTKKLEILKELEDYSISVTRFNFPQARKIEAYPSQYITYDSFKEWYKTCYREDKETIFIVTGSLYFISEVRKSFEEM